MEAAIDRIMQTYDLLVNRSAAASAEARAKVTDYVDNAVRGRRKGSASPDGVRADLFARTRRLQRSGEGRVYRAVGFGRLHGSKVFTPTLLVIPTTAGIQYAGLLG